MTHVGTTSIIMTVHLQPRLQHNFNKAAAVNMSLKLWQERVCNSEGIYCPII